MRAFPECGDALNIETFVNADTIAQGLAVFDRVKRRVQEGGHHVPDEVVKRRFHAGARNFFNLYQPLIDS